MIDEIQRRLDAGDFTGVTPRFQKNAGLSVSLPVFVLVRVICQMSRPSNDLADGIEPNEVRIVLRPFLQPGQRLFERVVVLEVELTGLDRLRLRQIDRREERHAVPLAGHVVGGRRFGSRLGAAAGSPTASLGHGLDNRVGENECESDREGEHRATHKRRFLLVWADRSVGCGVKV